MIVEWRDQVREVDAMVVLRFYAQKLNSCCSALAQFSHPFYSITNLQCSTSPSAPFADVCIRRATLAAAAVIFAIVSRKLST